MNIRSMEVSFWRRKSKTAGFAQLYCCITVDGKQLNIGSTGLTVEWDHWDGKRISSQDPQAHFKNERISIMHDQLQAIYNTQFRERKTITAGGIKRAYLGQAGSVSLAALFELYLRDAKTDPERKLTTSTLTVYNNVRKKLVDFLIHEKALDLTADEFDLSWAKRYRRWMAGLAQPDGSSGHAESYIIKQTQTIKNVLIWAKLHHHIASNPLEGMKLKAAEFAEPLFITEAQFQALRKHRFERAVLQETADVFIILCRSGFHYGDLVDLVAKHKTSIRQGLDDKPWLIKKRIKTEVAIRVPLFDEVKAIVERYGGWEKLPLRPLPSFNEFLKVVAAQVDLPAKLTSKAGRKTFTDWCFNVLGLSTDAILVLLGRKSSKGLEVYGRPDERRVIAELKESKVLKKGKARK